MSRYDQYRQIFNKAHIINEGVKGEEVVVKWSVLPCLAGVTIDHIFDYWCILMAAWLYTSSLLCESNGWGRHSLRLIGSLHRRESRGKVINLHDNLSVSTYFVSLLRLVEWFDAELWMPCGFTTKCADSVFLQGFSAQTNCRPSGTQIGCLGPSIPSLLHSPFQSRLSCGTCYDKDCAIEESLDKQLSQFVHLPNAPFSAPIWCFEKFFFTEEDVSGCVSGFAQYNCEKWILSWRKPKTKSPSPVYSFFHPLINWLTCAKLLYPWRWLNANECGSGAKICTKLLVDWKQRWHLRANEVEW